MKLTRMLTAGLIAVPMLWGGLVLGQQQQQQSKPGCDPQSVPQKVEGQVTNVDNARSAIAVRGADGKTYELAVDKDQLKSYKVGDRITATLSKPPAC